VCSSDLEINRPSPAMFSAEAEMQAARTRDPTELHAETGDTIGALKARTLDPQADRGAPDYGSAAGLVVAPTTTAPAASAGADADDGDAVVDEDAVAFTIPDSSAGKTLNWKYV